VIDKIFNVMTYFVIAQKLYKNKIPILPFLICRLMRLFFSCEIPYTARIDKTVRFAHNALGVVIGDDTVIGKNSVILQNVTIGGRSGIRANPVIGENVLIGAGACVLGDVKIGDNAKVGANAVVLEDVPKNGMAVGVPARIIQKGGS